MTIAFYADVHVPLAVVEGLRDRGIDVLRAQEDGMDKAADPLILDRSTALDRILITQDDDFLIEAAYRQRNGLTFSGIVYGHQLRVTISSMIRDLELIASVLTSDDLRNQIEHLPF